ncbi:sodium- and chloride-dependent neutral and basic amino acid transporter B(0+)-like isoform X2 [Drosophila subpulchrella]|uniref:sodium- and chloride-dependent neutral and basic amino acid transporter B(0+)-like isoform X2 n=1 Tax=Drosophila subpulchrella TaxID=1486046 RepID=UPI0018A19C7A|nr:sodium- and chloride-dependent neutral and basic amino acid transporter B(0+)-like isoform X2 [Drosophila subpulchrella]
MVYETTYGTGKNNFSPDLNRGKWEKPTDYIFACLGLALKMDVFDITYYFHWDMGILGILPYFVYVVIYLVPIIFIHSFMGQFSSSGFISAFRLSPFFKGMGYLSVFLTLSMLIYYSIYAALPLLFIINSFRPTLPWSCEGLKSWFNATSGRLTICNESISGEYSEIQNATDKRILHVPSVLYYESFFDGLRGKGGVPEINDAYELSWHFVVLFALVWAVIAFIFYKFSDTAKFGKFLRYMVICTLILILVCFVRFLFLPGDLSWLGKYIAPKPYNWALGTASTFFIAIQVFGAGWGSVIALSSFNGFKTNIMSYSWIISIGQIFIFITFGLVACMLEQHFRELADASDKRVLNVWLMFLSSASALSTMGWPNLWTIIYYTTLLMAAIILITTQIFTVLQSLFDEFEELRVRKQEVTFGLIAGLAFCSIFFCTNHGITYFACFYSAATFSYILLHVLLLLVVLWIYGPQRFKRDIEFMLGQLFAPWKIYILRYIAPIVLLICMPIGIRWSIEDHSNVSMEFLVMGIIVVWLPILAIPGYGFYFLSQNTGSFWERIRRSCRPTDWYPVEMEHRQRYEEAVGNTEAHQLVEVTEEVN